MTLKLKITLIVSAIIILFGVVVFGIKHFIISPSFLALEHQEAITDLKRSMQAFQREIKFHDHFVWDWSSWDDTYEFIETRYDEYIKINLVLETFSDSDINVLYFIDTSGKIVWGETRDRQTQITHISEFPSDALPANHPLLSFKTENKPVHEVGVAGVYMTSKGPMMISSRPILTSENKGPIRGFVIIGKYLTDKIIKKLVEQTEVDFQIFPIMAGALPESLKEIPSRITDETPYLIKSTSVDYNDAYAVLTDINGDAALLLMAKLPKNISAKGAASMRYAMYSFLAAGFVVFIVIYLLLQILVFRPLKKFTNHVISIEKTSDLSVKFPVKHQDEIGILSKEFNRMLEQIKNFQAELELKVNERTAELTTATRNEKWKCRNGVKSVLDFSGMIPQFPPLFS